MKINTESKHLGVVNGPALAVDALIFSIKENALQVLLLKISDGPYKDKWALPGGLAQLSETLDDTIVRILKDKAGIKKLYTEQLYTFSDLNRDCRGRIVSTAYMSLVDSGAYNLKTVEEYYSEITWFPVNKLPVLAFDHKKIIQYGIARLQNKIEYSNIAYSLLPREFTLADIQKVYEIILGKKLDKRNFRKKIRMFDILEESGGLDHSAKRPARLYRFKKQSLLFVK
jgi:8-oxo-dGTP diphosphatase